MTTNVRKRDKLSQIWLSTREKEMFNELAEKEGLAMSQLVRQWIRREWQRVFGEKKGEER